MDNFIKNIDQLSNIASRQNIEDFKLFHENFEYFYNYCCKILYKKKYKSLSTHYKNISKYLINNNDKKNTKILKCRRCGFTIFQFLFVLWNRFIIDNKSTMVVPNKSQLNEIEILYKNLLSEFLKEKNILLYALFTENYKNDMFLINNLTYFRGRDFNNSFVMFDDCAPEQDIYIGHETKLIYSISYDHNDKLICNKLNKNDLVIELPAFLFENCFDLEHFRDDKLHMFGLANK